LGVTIEDGLEVWGDIGLRPPGTLCVSGPRELLVRRSVFAAFQEDGQVDIDTVRPYLLGDAGRLSRCRERLSNRFHDAGSMPPISATHGEAVVWAGFVVDHYGHLLTECISRLWPLLPGGAFEGLPAVIASEETPPYAREWLDAFGIERVPLPEQGAARFAELHVPEPALHYNAWMCPEVRDVHLHARQALAIPRSARSGVLWLSRSGLGFNRRFAYDECLLEWLLERHVRIVRPETLTLTQQVEEFETTQGIAGILGSAFYTSLLARDAPPCVFLCPPKVESLYLTVAELVKMDTAFVHALEVASPPGNPPRRYRLLIPHVLRTLGETVLPELSADPRIAQLLELDRASANHRRVAGGDDLDAALMAMLADPLSWAPRLRLGRAFEARGSARCAAEQYATAADLDGGQATTEAQRGARRLLDEPAVEIPPTLERALRRVGVG
jgi:hypothetical protein